MTRTYLCSMYGSWAKGQGPIIKYWLYSLLIEYPLHGLMDLLYFFCLVFVMPLFICTL